MAIKLDLEKAYDHLEWGFIRDTLKLFKFPDRFVSLIVSCVSTTFVSVLFNRGTLDSFQPSRGIRQGDPISPYLFLLCMEFLGAHITSMCEGRRWDKVRASRSGPSFSHVFFADDLMLFAKVDRRIAKPLSKFWIISATLLGRKLILRNQKFCFLLMLLVEGEEAFVEDWGLSKLVT